MIPADFFAPPAWYGRGLLLIVDPDSDFVEVCEPAALADTILKGRGVRRGHLIVVDLDVAATGKDEELPASVRAGREAAGE